jgi:uncharacterized protein involved in type VI secretion and phage assembly
VDTAVWFVPDIGNEVLVVFEGGDPSKPYVIGALWNGQSTPPKSMDADGKNPIKAIHSRNGLSLTLDDTDWEQTFTMRTPGGQKITLTDRDHLIEIADSNGNSIELGASAITITAAARVTVSASVVEVSAGMLTVNASLSKFSGVVQADTLITNSVISASYTPGAGNIW